jgi:peptidoglycan/xylan/chitin deacetylase (PgdA/CDA1 family)
MKYLKTEGYQPIRVADLAAAFVEGKPLPPKPIILTFDDGYSDNYQNAFPILKKYKFVATFFVVTGFVDEKRTGYMNWDQLEDMAIAGNEIGSHSLTHPDLQGKSQAFQDTEIAGSKLLIESRIGTPVVSFSYPAGDYDARTLATLRETGYLAAVTEIAGTSQTAGKLLELQRIRIRGRYSVNDFAYWLKYFLSK